MYPNFTLIKHSFANPLTSNTEVDQDYFNIIWGGVRPSNLLFALEPKNNALDYGNPSNVNNVDYMELCPWSGGDAEIESINQLGGYTTFVGDGLIAKCYHLCFLDYSSYVFSLDAYLSQYIVTSRSIYHVGSQKVATAQVRLRLDIIRYNCQSMLSHIHLLSDLSTCMVSSCYETQVTNSGYTRLPLGVPSNGPNCVVHNSANPYADYVALTCNFKLAKDFGQTNCK